MKAAQLTQSWHTPSTSTARQFPRHDTYCKLEACRFGTGLLCQRL